MFREGAFKGWKGVRMLPSGGWYMLVWQKTPPASIAAQSPPASGGNPLALGIARIQRREAEMQAAGAGYLLQICNLMATEVCAIWKW
jgi:hypothetical protein